LSLKSAFGPSCLSGLGPAHSAGILALPPCSAGAGQLLSIKHSETRLTWGANSLYLSQNRSCISNPLLPLKGWRSPSMYTL